MLILGTTTITMNRGEQETLYKQARNIRLHQESKAQHSSDNLNSKTRHHSYENIHQLHSSTSDNFHKHGMNYRSIFGNEQHPTTLSACDNLVLSVSKSPLKDQSLLSNFKSVAATRENIESAESSVNRMPLTKLPSASHKANPQVREYSTLQTSEDDLADDVELALETTELNDTKDHGLKFLRRFRKPKFEVHHRQVPTPMRRKNIRSRSKSTVDVFDSVNEPISDETDVQHGAAEGNEGVENPYYPIALPIDQAFKAKYVFHHRRGKTFQERLYVFLEHPGGWLCFIYHFTV